MELKVNEYQLPEVIAFNYEEIKNELAERVHIYETVVYDDTQIKQAKADRADLNRFKKALNDERIRREKEYLKPFEDFKNKINELIKIVDKPCEIIDKQIKTYEEDQKTKKREEIEQLFELFKQEEDTADPTAPPDWLKLEQIFDSKWLNASIKLPAIKSAMADRIENINYDLATLHDLPNFGFEATEVYKSTLDINRAIQEGKRLEEIQRRKEEAERMRAEAEAKAREELEQTAAQEEVAPTACQPADPVEVWEEEEPAAYEELPMWVNFSALLTVNQAAMLKNFFEDHGIRFEAI